MALGPFNNARALGKWAGDRLAWLALARAATPVDPRLVGRTLLRAALVGAVAGLIGAGFFWLSEHAEHWILERLIGYRPLRAEGEALESIGAQAAAFTPFLLVLSPAIGALISGLLSARNPLIRGGGTDAMIEAFHEHDGQLSPRLIGAKTLASVATLASGGAGGREGPTMFIGGAVGTWVAGLFRLDVRERRLLLVAGAAAGISAVFRTPLGAALLAVEVLYRDGFESDALVPAILASVVSYSVVISLIGHTALFGSLPRFPFVPAHLLLFALLALVESVVAAGFVRALQFVRRRFDAMPVRPWAKPALGGLALGALCTPVIMFVGERVGQPGQGLGLLGGGYGAVQLAISGAAWLPSGYEGMRLLAFMALAKVVAASLTLGSGGSAGDFAPSLAVGGLVGGAFGRACQLLLEDASLDPAAFALVGMGTFYGGIAHAPLSALVLVCEMAGSYDLLVPLMLTEGIAFVALRSVYLYPAQVASQAASPAHRAAALDAVFAEARVATLMKPLSGFTRFHPSTPLMTIWEALAVGGDQDAFPVLDDNDRLVGVITYGEVRSLSAQRDSCSAFIAADVMHEPVVTYPEDDLLLAARQMLEHGMRELLVVSRDGQIIGFLDEADLTRWYIGVIGREPG